MMEKGFDESEVDSLLHGNQGNDSEKMCRKCFRAYSRAMTMFDTLKSNLLKCVNV